MTIDELDRWLAERNLSGFWSQQHGGTPMKPYLWKWVDIHEGIKRAIDVVPMDQTGRRVVQMRNPSLKLGMSNTIHLSGYKRWSLGKSQWLIGTSPPQFAMSFKGRRSALR